MHDKTFKCIVAAIFWVLELAVIAGVWYACYELFMLTKDMPYGPVAAVIFLGTIAAAIVYIVLESVYYVAIFREYHPKMIST